MVVNWRKGKPTTVMVCPRAAAIMSRFTSRRLFQKFASETEVSLEEASSMVQTDRKLFFAQSLVEESR